jgi:hypothetical protein
MAKQPETLLLVAVKGTRSQIIKEGIASILTTEGKKLKKETAWKGYYFQLRSKDGYKAKPIWPEGKKL